MLKNYLNIFDFLRKNELEQFKSDISASQYIPSYKAAKHYIKKNMKVLDWGAGNGHFSYFLLKEDFIVTGFIIQEETVLSKQLKKDFEHKYSMVVNLEESVKLPFADNSFDAVVSIGVLEHVRATGGDEIESLKEIKRILKSNGVFVCSHLPNKYSWIEFLTKFMKNKHHHQYRYNRPEIRDMLNKIGFKLLETKRYGFFPRLMFKTYQTSYFITKLFNISDSIGAFIFNPICQNHYFVAIKP